MTKKALLVGINYIRDPTCRLQGCIDDIDNIKDVLLNNYDYAKENVTQLRDDASDEAHQPTRANMLAALKALVAESANLSEIWFHYSGHGSQVRDRNMDEADGLDEVVVPSDFRSAGFITDDEIFNIIKDTRCKTMLLFDSCHSATVCDLQWSFEYNYNGGFIKTQNNIKKIENPYVFVISGCKDAQTSADSYSQELREPVGAFTDAFIHCLTANKFTVNILKVYADLCTYIRQEGYSQKPILSCSSMIPSYVFIQAVPLPTPPAVSTAVPSFSSPIVPPSIPSGVVVAPSSVKDNVILGFGGTSASRARPAMPFLVSPPPPSTSAATSMAATHLAFTSSQRRNQTAVLGNMLGRL